jgi:Chloramphenicol phosphotransferase-like protein
MNNIIYLFGASCSGKSTLGNALQNSLGSQWTYVDRDDLIEQGLCSDSTANTALEEKVQSIKNRVIIDAQIPWRKKREGELYFLVLPPLKTLLERDTARTEQLKRTEKCAYDAKKYVIKTHQILNQIEKIEFNYCFDSSQVSVQDEVNTVTTFIQTPVYT